MTFPRIRRYPINDRGRDFVVGDIHGAFDAVMRGLELLGFDQNADRVFSLGDLINRGRNSPQALEFLKLPFVHALRGNHDHSFASMSLEEIRMCGYENRNGMGWVVDVSDERLTAMKESFKKLPLLMELETIRGKVGFLHGDIPAGLCWPEFVRKIDNRDEAATTCALWGRDRVDNNDCSGVEGIGRVYVGHSVQWDGPRQLGNLVAIDTGAVFREGRKNKGSLTILNVTCSTELIQPRPGITVENEFIFHAEPGHGSFSSEHEIPRPQKAITRKLQICE